MNFNRTIAAANRWRDNYNPLRGLTMSRAVSLMEAAQRGEMADLQWLYGSELGIEATDSDLMTIIEKTQAGIADMDWQIIIADENSTGFDPKLAEEQAAFLRASYGNCDNLFDAIQHLVLARFRGFSHLAPWMKEDWTLEHLEPLPQWNMVRNGTRSEWAWNPEARQKSFLSLGTGAALTPDQYILLENRRPVNRIALIKYVRSTVAEKDWDAYCDIYGIPGVFIIMPPNIPDGKEPEYAAQAEAAAEAASGSLPNGSDVKTLSEVRGVQPFQLRLEWLQKQLVRAGTGGELTTLAEPTGIGGGASGVQDSAWQTIVRRMAHLIEQPLNRQYDRRALAAIWPGRPALASFALRAKQEKDVNDAVDSISKLSQAGYLVDPEQVTAETGYEVTLKPQQAVHPMPGQVPSAAAVPTEDVAATALNGAQVTSMVTLLQQASQGQIPKDSIMPILEAAFPNVSVDVLREIVGPLDSFNAAQAIARAKASFRGRAQTPAAPQKAKDILAEIAATILDGSKPFEEALKEAQKKLEAVDPGELAGDLQSTLENAMFEAAAAATAKKGK